jgi:hypothetical protein
MSGNEEYPPTTEDEVGVAKPGNGRQVFPMAPTDRLDRERAFSMRVPGLTETASNCLIKALHLAKELHHTEVTAAHFIVAMTLIERANKQFVHRNLDANSAWRASMAVLIDMERVLSGADRDPPLAVELINVLTDARRSAEYRDNQEASIDDVLTAFSKLSLESAARKLVLGVGPTRPTTPAEEARDAIRRLEESLGRRLDTLSDLLRRPEPAVPPEHVSTSVLGWLGSQLGPRR